MALPRRRVVRPVCTPAHIPRQLQKLRTRLEQERAALRRWMARLKRAFHAVEKHQTHLTRLERQLTQVEES